MDSMPSNRSLPLATHAMVDTRDPGAAQDEVGRIFCSHRLTPSRHDAAHFHAVHNSARHDGFSINYVAYGADVEIDPGRLDRFFLLQIPLVGGAQVQCGATVVDASTANATLLSPTLPTVMRWYRGTAKLIVLIERQVVETHLSCLLERTIERIEFAPALPLDAPMGAAIRSQAMLMQALSERAVRPADRWSIAHRQLRDSLVGLMLAAQTHSHSQQLARPAAAPAPTHVKRAEEYIAAHAQEALSIADLAATAGVGLRTLQAGFRRFRDTSIGEAVLDARLRRWHDALADPTRTEGVVDLALSAGLSHPGRAAAAYRRRFGESPSTTCRRHKD